MADSVDAAVRPAAQAGAQVLYDEVQRNVGRIKKHTGKLASSIYQAYARSKSTDGRAVYAISWNARKAPHGHLVEYGHLQRYEISYDPKTKRFTTHKDRPLNTPKLVAARPFVRPAMDKFPAALAAVEGRLFEELAKSGVTS
jgi:hypothetical protein